MSPFGEATASAALANLEEALQTLRWAMRARTSGGAWALVVQAQTQATNAAAKLRDALELEELTTNQEENAAQ